MSLIGDLVFDFLGELLGVLFGRLFHATGRLLIFLFTSGYVRISSLRHGGVEGDGSWSNVGVQLVGFLFWLAALALTLYLLLA